MVIDLLNNFNYIYNNEKYEIIHEVVEQYRVEVEAENEALAREGFENGNFDDNLIEKMSDIAPYEDWQTVLYIRGDYELQDLDSLPKDMTKSVEKILKLCGK
jgi:hypothetical protein